MNNFKKTQMDNYQKIIYYVLQRFNKGLNPMFMNGLLDTRIQPYAHVRQGSNDWFGARKKNLITCSTISKAIPGANPYMSRKKFARVLLGLEMEPPVNDFSKALMQHGTDWESAARDIYHLLRKMGIVNGSRNIVKNSYILETGSIVSLRPDVEFSGSPDGIYFGDDEEKPVLMEIKCPPRAEIPTAIPFQYLTQVLGMMHLLEINVCDFIYFKPQEQMRIFRVDFNDRAFQNMNNAINNFLNDQIYDIGKLGDARFQNVTAAQKKKAMDDIYNHVPQRIICDYFI